jgi:uncharacterized protein YycO
MKKVPKVPKVPVWVAIIMGIAVVAVLVGLRFHNVCKVLKEERKCARADVDTHQFRSGDILLFNGLGARGNFGAHLTRMCVGTGYTHIGMVYVHTDTGRPYVWEMHLTGSRLMPLRAKMRNYRGTCSVRSLSPALSVEKQRAFDQFIRSRWGDPYSYHFITHGYNRLFRFLPMPVTGGQKRQDAYYCCDLVADTLKEVGVLDFNNTDHPSELTPRDFTTRRQRLPMRAGFSYGPEICLVVPKTKTPSAPVLPK